jgi:Nicotianamine synthase protein
VRTEIPPPTPTASATRQAQAPTDVVAGVSRIHERLAACDDLRPDDHVDGLFRQLVHYAIATADHVADAVMGDAAIQALRPHLVELCARGEHELERMWACRVATSRVPAVALSRFPYLDNYHLLTGLEHRTLARATVRATTRPPRRILFVGAGPLPLSALLLARAHPGVPVDTIDHDPDAVALARTVTARFGAGRVRHHRRELADCDDLGRYDLVVLAALVGLAADEKRDHLRHLHDAMAPGALLLARSAHGLKTLLYPVVDAGALAPYEVLAVVHPTGPVLNSVVLARKRGGATRR